MTNFKELKAGERWIEDIYGFQLTWGEKLALSHYFENFKNIAKENRFSYKNGFTEAIIRFLDDYFNIPVNDLERVEVLTFENKKIVWKYYGLGLDDHPNFKEYCKLKVNEWREERNLI